MHSPISHRGRSLVLEAEEHALARGAKILAEVRGFGSAADAGHIVTPGDNGDAALRAMRGALKEGGVSAGDVGLVNAHATSTPQGDRSEATAIYRLLGNGNFWVTSNKGALGHLQGAAGAVEAAFTVLSITEGVVPLVRNCLEPDVHPDINHRVVVDANKTETISAAISNSFGFGGTNAALLFTRYD